MRAIIEYFLGVILICFTYGVLANPNPFENNQGSWVDLTYPFSDDTLYWPTAETFNLTPVFYGITTKGFFYSANNFKAAEHGGTHVDAPIHFSKDKQTLEQIPIDRLMGPTQVIDVTDKTKAKPDYLITIEDMQAFEAQNGPIPEDTIILLRTGFGQYWPDAKKYLGTSLRKEAAIPELHFPGLHQDAATWLVEQRKIKAIGIDTASIDYGQSKLFEAHQVLAKHNVPIFENVAYLDQLPQTGAYLVALPMKIQGGSGGPLRLIAWIPNQKQVNQ